METPPAQPSRACANCEAPLVGPFCARCGQEARRTARSMRTLLHDAFENLTNLDGRLWVTVRGLLLRPGLLSVEYLADHRARYLSPFRLYLVVSVLFFAVGLSIDAQPEPLREDPAAVASPAEAEKQARSREEIRQFCELIPAEVAPQLNARLKAACRRTLADRGMALRQRLVDNLPPTMFVFLPVMALALHALFGRSRRFYVEHVVFTLHLQSAMFVALTAGLFLENWTLLDPVDDALMMAVATYMLWYVYRALRVVYRESRPRTLVKLMACSFIYGVLLAISALSAAIYSALYV